MGINPWDNPKQYDAVILAGARSPGVCTLDPERVYGWDVQKGKGKDGATTILNGSNLAEFEVEFKLWKEPGGVDHFDRWDRWVSLLQKPVKEGDKKALDIYHPQLEAVGIRMVVVKSLKPPKPQRDGTATARVKFLEYNPAKTNAGKLKGSASKPGAPDGKPDPNADLKDELRVQREIRDRQRNGDFTDTFGDIGG